MFCFVFVPSESVQDIEAALTEMESCTRLLFPDFSLSDFHTASSSSSNVNPPEGEEPCCSKTIQENQDLQEKRTGRMENQDECSEQHDGKEKEADDEEELSEEDSSSEEEVDEDLFIRNSGLVSHSYSLDVSLSPGGYRFQSPDWWFLLDQTFLKQHTYCCSVSGTS